MTTSDQTVPAFEIRLLGTFSVHIEGKPIKVLGSRAGNMLAAYLALHQGQMVDRASLADSIWPDSSHKAAMDNLRHCLVQVRRALGAEASRLQSPSAFSLSLDLSGAYVDVHDFERLMSSNDFHDLVTGIKAYTGRLFKDCTGEWIELERNRLHALFQEGLERITTHEETVKTPGAAIEALGRVFAADQTSEPAARALMTASAAVGNFDTAAETYSKLRLRLRHAFNAVPTAETTAHHKRIRIAQREEESGPNQTACPGNPDSIQKGYIPPPLTRLVGRNEALLNVQASLDASRLVTLTGIGGIGKTQLAVAVAHALMVEYSAGAWFVDLSSLRHPSQMPREILSVMRETTGDEGAEAALLRVLADRSLLLVLDNCEHLVPGCSRLVKGLLARCGNVRILATSRCSLRVQGELVWRVPALSLPRPKSSSGIESVRTVSYTSKVLSTIMDYSGIRLFAERATRARQMFAVTADNVSGVVEICRRLDGIPLAIELAAPWVRSLSVEQIRVRLERHFELLKSRDTSIPLRHRTLLAAVDWSYNLLSTVEQSVWRQISVFIDGFTLEAAEAVVDLPQGESQILELITSLIDASVLVYSEQNGVGRYVLPETLRQYGLSRQDSSEAIQTDVRARFVQYFASLGETAAPNLLGADQASWLDRIDRERGNLRAAFKYADSPEIGADGLKLAAAVWRYYYVRGYYAEGYNAIVRLLKFGTDVEASLCASAETAAGNLAFQSGEFSKAHSHFETSLRLCVGMKDTSGRARSLANLALISNARGDYARARALLDESRTLFDDIDDTRNLSVVLGNLAITACNLEDYESAYRYHEASIQLFRETGDMQRVGMALANMAGLCTSQGEFGSVLPMLMEALEISRRQGSAAILAHCLLILLAVSIENHKYDVGAVCAGADAALRQRFHIPLPDEVGSEQTMLIATVKDALEPHLFRDLYEWGEMMEHDEVVTYLGEQFLDRGT